MVQLIHRRIEFRGAVAEGGNDSYVTVLNHASLNFNDFLTVNARVYLNPADKLSQGSNRSITSKSNGGGADGGFWLEYNDSPATAWRRCFRAVVSGVECYTAYTVPMEAGWYYVTLTHNKDLPSNQIRLYQNAMLVATATLAAPRTANVRNVVLGGINGAAYMYKGYMSEVQVYNRALAEAEINYNYLHPNCPIRRGCVLSLVQDQIDRPAAGTWRDTSPQMGNNGTITNATTSKYPCIPAGRNALFFPTAAGTDRVDCGNGASLQLVGTLSGEFWIKTSRNYAGWIILGAKLNGPVTNGWQFVWWPTNKILYLYSNDGFAIQSVAVPEFLDGSWKHIVFTQTPGAATGEIYINGINKTALRFVRALTDSANSLYVGNTSGFAMANVGGYIASARIYNRILSPAEVAYNHEHPNNPIKRGRVLDLSQESLFGSYWYDLSGNANNGTITGAQVKNLGQVDGR